MSGRGGRRAGSGRKKVFESKAAAAKFWQKGKTRIWIDNNLYLAWFAARTKCGYSNHSSFVSHLLALERRRRLVSMNCGLTKSYSFMYTTLVFFVGLIKKKESSVTIKESGSKMMDLRNASAILIMTLQVRVVNMKHVIRSEKMPRL